MQTLLWVVLIAGGIELVIGFVLISLYGEKGQNMRAMELEMLLEVRNKPNIQGEQRKRLEKRIEKLRRPVDSLHYAGIGVLTFGGIGFMAGLLALLL